MGRLLDHLHGHSEVLQRLLDAHGKDRLASTLLFSGPSGIGKRLAARVLAQTLICENPQPEACGVCGACRRVESGQSESLLVVEPDGSAIKIEQARDVLQFISLRKIGRARVILIDQAHLLNPQAANALLKSLEEPPLGTYFILLTSLAASVLPTIRSRAQLVRFSPLKAVDLKKILGEEADDWVIESAFGSVENAKRLLESREEFQELESVAVAYLSAAGERFPAEEVSRLKELTKERAAQAYFATLVQTLIRDGLKGRASAADPMGDIVQRLAEIPPRTLSELAESSLAVEADMARNVDRGLVLENFAIQLRRSLAPITIGS